MRSLGLQFHYKLCFMVVRRAALSLEAVRDSTLYFRTTRNQPTSTWCSFQFQIPVPCCLVCLLLWRVPFDKRTFFMCISGFPIYISYVVKKIVLKWQNTKLISSESLNCTGMKIKENFETFLKIWICILIFLYPAFLCIHVCVCIYNMSVYVYVYVSEYVHMEKGTTEIKYPETPLHFSWIPQIIIT